MKDSWIELTLDDVCSKITDGAHHSPKSVEVGKPMGSVKDMTPFGLNLKTSRLIGNDDFDKLVKLGCKPEVDDVLISKDGNSALNTVCLIRKPIDAVLLSSVAILRPDLDIIVPDFLRLYLDAEPTRQYLKATSISGAAIPRVILKDFKRAKIRLPSCLKHQKLISNHVSNYDNLIENNNRRITILEDMAQSLYREWFVNFRYPGHAEAVDGPLSEEKGNQKLIDSPLGQIPEGWEVCKLESMSSMKYGKMSKKELRCEEGIPIYSGYKITGYYPEANLNESKVIVVARGVGGTGDVKMSPDTCWLTNLSIYIMENEKNLKKAYLFYQLKFANLRSLDSGTSISQITIADLSKFKIIVPPIEIQERFEDICNTFWSQIKVLTKQNENLKKQRGMLLPKLISGQIELKD